MNSLLGLHHIRNQKHRRNRHRRQRDGLPNHDNTFENMSRQSTNDFLSRLQEIREDRKRTKWEQEEPAGKKILAFTIREVKVNHYEGHYYDL